MALILRGKTPVRFEVSDLESETFVTLQPEDDQDTLVRKLRRVIALCEGERRPALTYPTGVREFLGPQKAVGRAMEPPTLPDYLKGEVELEEPAAPGNGWAAKGAGE